MWYRSQPHAQSYWVTAICMNVRIKYAVVSLTGAAPVFVETTNRAIHSSANLKLVACHPKIRSLFFQCHHQRKPDSGLSPSFLGRTNMVLLWICWTESSDTSVKRGTTFWADLISSFSEIRISQIPFGCITAMESIFGSKATWAEACPSAIHIITKSSLVFMINCISREWLGSPWVGSSSTPCFVRRCLLLYCIGIVEASCTPAFAWAWTCDDQVIQEVGIAFVLHQ